MSSRKTEVLYCPVELKPDEDCPACGAGPESGICQAKYRGPPPEELVRIILVERVVRVDADR